MYKQELLKSGRHLIRHLITDQEFSGRLATFLAE